MGRGFPVHGFVGAVVKAKAAKQISKMFGNKFVVLILYLTFFPLELRMLARTYFFHRCCLFAYLETYSYQ